MLSKRLIFGPLMVLAALGLFWLDWTLDHVQLSGFWQGVFDGREYLPSGVPLVVMAIVLIPLASRELAAIFRANGLISHTWLIALASVVAAVTVYATPRSLSAPTGVTIISSVLIICFLATLYWHARDMRVEGAVAAAGATMFAVAYLGLLSGFLLATRRWHAAWVVLAVILITKSCDIGAYFTGRYLGRHKLIPWLSPKKTWEGLAGGVVLAVLVCMAFAYLSQVTDFAAAYMTQAGQRIVVETRFSIAWAIPAGIVFALLGQLGDLTVSLFKRDAGVKDSGQAIPGFGGVLDVLDSPLLVAPAAFWLLELHADARAIAP